ncbi:MAG: hypothetical protein HY023_02880 [Chloroflexi bacterium]|nr:hypothetical protein [Chloroflexota bacterium]
MAALAAQFDEHEHLLLASPAVARFVVVKRRALEREGYIRVRAELIGGGLLEFSEFWDGAAEGEIDLREYTYHWQDAIGQLVRRWDTAKHHPDLPHAPHHIHLADGTTVDNPWPATLQSVIKEIEEQVSPPERKSE